MFIPFVNSVFNYFLLLIAVTQVYLVQKNLEISVLFKVSFFISLVSNKAMRVLVEKKT